ncbi:multidrug effflux MFS transporter [Pseudomonas sp. G5(2012)]|uniref:multidrug effflux MFS transporter n=1 Tax=Pseudomonas sp. G5(2012) TaxID=1268068 RepID=UPI0005B526F3
MPKIMEHKMPPMSLLVLITMSGTLAMHMFVPALPYSASELGASAGDMQMTISLYIIGLAVGQLFYGPMSDTFGRRPMLLIGLGLYTIAGICAALSENLYLLVGARLLQALGGCAGLSLGRAIVRDTAGATTVVSQLALLNLMMMIGPGFAPILGSAISATLGWRAIFWFLALLGLIAFFFTWRLLPETSNPSGGLSVSRLAKDYKQLLSNARYMGFTLGGGCTTTSIYAFIASAPFVFVTQLHRPLHEVGLYLGLLIFGMSVGNALTGRLIQRIPVDRLLLAGNTLCLVSACILLLTILAGHLQIVTMLSLMFLFSCGIGVAGPTALAKSMNSHPNIVGSASGFYGFTQMTAGAICTSIAAVGSQTALSAVTILAAAAFIGQVAIWIALCREHRVATSPQTEG